MVNFSVLIPTRNGGLLWEKCASSIMRQSYKPSTVIVIDSLSNDGSLDVAKRNSFNYSIVSPEEFNHGGTRNKAAELASNADILVFMTQDAVLEGEHSLRAIVQSFEGNSKVAAVCGRQLPHIDANPLAAHARLFNYPGTSAVKSFADVSTHGIKVAFASNSFTAYRKSVFDELCGFPENTILSEDMHLASRMIIAGYQVVYNADAVVRHSHNYTPSQEFKRYFDIGVFHANEPWIQDAFGSAGGEGARFVKSEIQYLFKNAPLWIPRAIFTTACKLVGYKLGKNYKILPKSWRPKFSMFKNYWLQNNNND